MSKDLASIFKTYDIRGQVGEQLTPENVKNIGKAFADWLPTTGIVAVGHDMRPDSKELADAFIEGLNQQGYDVWDIGLVTSDMIYFAVGKWELAGGAVITASHNPGKDNGIKLYRDKVIAVGLDAGLGEIRDAVLANHYKPFPRSNGNCLKKNITKEWVDHCLTFVKQLQPFKVVIDAGNGMAGEVLPEILPSLPIKVTKLYFELDGSFPNHEANPQQIENLQDLINTIKNNQADFGIAFDGDGDRAVFVDDKGRPVLGTDLLTIIAKLYLDKYPGSKIVHDVRTSRASQELIRKWGGEPIRTKAGRVYIGSLMRQIKAPYGGETTGHMFFKENYDADSGLITALVAMQAITNSGLRLSELVDQYRLYAMIPEMNLPINVQPKKIFDKLSMAFRDGKQDWLDGLTVNYPDYWFNLRASNTEPVMRLNVEAKNNTQLDSIVTKITDLIVSE